MSLLGDDASDMSQISNATTCSERSNASYDRTSKGWYSLCYFTMHMYSTGCVSVIVKTFTNVSCVIDGMLVFSVFQDFSEINVSSGKIHIKSTFPQSMNAFLTKQILKAYEAFNLPSESVTKYLIVPDPNFTWPG